jgi:hypothetical protein
MIIEQEMTDKFEGAIKSLHLNAKEVKFFVKTLKTGCINITFILIALK